jgi:hypothetical protein
MRRKLDPRTPARWPDGEILGRLRDNDVLRA